LPVIWRISCQSLDVFLLLTWKISCLSLGRFFAGHLADFEGHILYLILSGGPQLTKRMRRDVKILDQVVTRPAREGALVARYTGKNIDCCWLTLFYTQAQVHYVSSTKGVNLDLVKGESI
jgi:hypothetical protein